MTDPQDPFAAPDPNEPPPPPGQQPPPGYGTPPPPGYGPPPPGYGPPPPGYGQPPYGAQPGFNTLAIIGFIAAFCCGPAGIVMGIIARKQITQRGERGDGLAIAAIVIGALGMLFNAFYLSAR